jgi:peptidylprolyl isomerase
LRRPITQTGGVVATSRRRERELARRRYERRRLREQQRRARARRRNTIIGAGVGTAVVIAGVVLLAVNLSGGSKSKSTSLAATPTPTPSVSTSATPPPPAPTKCAKISPNPPAKGEPKVPDVTGKAPTKLVVKDLKVGHGKAAKNGDQLTVNYVGVSCSTGTAFDASYTRHQPFTFQLGGHQVIPGWERGMLGMKVGGERELVIPASLGYGASGSGSIKPNETLIFVVSLVKIK